MSDIVIILAFVAIMIISSIRKSRALQKKAAAKQSGRTTPAEFDADAEYDEYEQVETQHDSTAPIMPAAENSAQASTKAGKYETRDTAANRKQNHTKQAKDSRDGQSSEKDFEFDLRRAIIESEILNPKYKQY